MSEGRDDEGISLFCSICRKFSSSNDVVRTADLTPAGTYTYIHRLNTVISLPDVGADYLCQKCAGYVHQLESLQLKIIEIENNLFNVYNSLKDEEEETFNDENTLDYLEPEVKVKLESPMKPKVSSVVRSLSSQAKVPREVYSCQECGNRFKTKKLLAKHLLKVHAINTPMTCSPCGTCFPSLADLSMHNKTVHASFTTCETCGKSVLKSSMYSHEKFHAVQGKCEFICDVCSRMFLTVGNLQTHMRTHSKEQPYSCYKCDKSFKWNSSLNTHIQAAHNKRQALFKCEVCERGFKDKTNLRKHEFTHGKPKPYNCSSCGKGFIRRDLFTRHTENCS